jgi:hypothetical protein
LAVAHQQGMHMPNKHLTTKQIKGRCYCGDIAYELNRPGFRGGQLV